MLLILLGLIVLIASGPIVKKDYRLIRFKNTFRAIGFAIMLIGILMSSLIQIDAGEIGVKKLFGKVQKDVLGSGLHFINPLLEIQKTGC